MIDLKWLESIISARTPGPYERYKLIDGGYRIDGSDEDPLFSFFQATEEQDRNSKFVLTMLTHAERILEVLKAAAAVEHEGWCDTLNNISTRYNCTQSDVISALSDLNEFHK